MDIVAESEEVEHMLNDRLMQFVNNDLQDVKEVRKRFDKASLHYDQVLTYAQQSRERSNYEQATLVERMWEFKRQIDRESRRSFSGVQNSPTGDGIQAVGRSSHKMIEAAMQSTAKGKAENAIDRMDWIEKITGVIASLLSSQVPEQRLPCSPLSSGHERTASDNSSLGSSSDFDHSVSEDYASQRCNNTGHRDHSSRGIDGYRMHGKQESPLGLLRKVPGNDVCADCGSPEPDWASLNLGVLLCIECSGVHRNLGVHISKGCKYSDC